MVNAEVRSRARLRQLPLVFEERLLRLLQRDAAKAQPVAGLELRDERQVEARHLANSRIPAGRLPVGHENDRRAARWQLNRAERDAFGQQLDGALKRERHAVESIAHAVRAGGDAKRRFEQTLQRCEIECVRVRAGNHAHDGVVRVLGPQTVRDAPVRRRSAMGRHRTRDSIGAIRRHARSQQISRPQRAPFVPTEIGAQIRAPALEHERNVDAAGHCDIGAAAHDGLSEAQRRATRHVNGMPGGDRRAVDRCTQVGAGQRDERRLVELERGTDQCRFEASVRAS